MAINVYLKGDEVKNVEGFVTKTRKQNGQEWNEYTLPGVNLWHDKGRWHTMLHEPTEPVPVAVANIVEEISFHEWTALEPHREAGIYRHESAEAEVEPDMIGGKMKLKIRIKAKKMEDLRELYRRIRVGSIRPEQSYEGPQDGLSRNQLETALDRTNEELEETLERSVEIIGNLADVMEDLIKLADELNKGLPFCFKSTVAKKVFAMINNRISNRHIN